LFNQSLLAESFSKFKFSKNMTLLQKITIAGLFTFGMAFFIPTPQAEAACDNAYDVTYPSRYCDPQGF